MALNNTQPIGFNGICGLLTLPVTDTWKDTGVVLCRPWSRDEVSCRKFYRVLADSFAARGYPVIRFDYPGQVDSLDMAENDGIDRWVEAANESASALKKHSGCERIVFFGLGLGTVIAQMAAQTRPDIAGLILAAPVTSGRRYLRELGLHAKMAFEAELLPLDLLDTDKVSLLGNVLPDKFVKDLAEVKLDKSPLPRKVPVLLFARDGVSSDRTLADHIQSEGLEISVHPFSGYDDLVGNILQSRPDWDLISTATDWLTNTLSSGNSEMPANQADLGPGRLETGQFREEALFVGAHEKHLYCIVTSPIEAAKTAPVFIFGNTGGYDHHAGRGREWVTAARKLAQLGVISVRFDGVNTGDSYPDLPEGQEALYSETQIEDFLDLIDYFEGRYQGPVTLIGRCSSAYSAFHAAARDPRVRQLVLINQLKFMWDPDVPVDLKYMGHRSTADYTKRLTSAHTFKRLFRGELNFATAGRGVAKMLRQRAAEKLAAVFPQLTKFGRLKAEALKKFEVLRERDVKVHFFCSVGDESVDQLKAHFGPDLKGFAAFPNISLTTVDNADHNLMPDHARAEMFSFLEKIAHLSDTAGQPPAATGDEPSSKVLRSTSRHAVSAV
ncbi:serine aminopeptidase domain-containing protein [Roseibium aggregatum]|uniref:Alpha/beta hydrolase n=1 Tax=Roseibium aggregatum TaxID=187304 RepID=A0A939EBV2_9HYPH|nr:alpha/beta hydrolase [Roseibium aggregatum]MBN9668754.1 alpha/beta hydrolase [Roseibium aggregatum]